MWKAKGRLVSLLSACLAALLTLVLGVATMNVQPKTAFAADDTGTLVTDASTLAVGDKIVIAAKDYNYALSTTQNSNNRGQAAVTKDNNTITFGDDVQILTVAEGTTNGTFAFDTGAGYLYAASSSSNYLRTEETLSANSSWKITVAEDGTATIVAQGANTRNTMQYNQSSSLFSCYGTASQKAICLYKLTASSEGGEETPETPKESFTIEYSYPSNVTFDGETSVTVEEGTSIDLPTTSAPEGYVFAGWVESEINTPTTAKPTIYTENYTVVEDKKLYAVYRNDVEAGGWKLVTDISSLASGDIVTIAAPKYSVAIGSPSGTTTPYFTTTTVTINDTALTSSSELTKLTVTKNDDNTFAFQTGDGYLSWSSGNSLTTNSSAYKWTVSITNSEDAKGTTSIKSVNDSSRMLQYNSGSPRFACYTSSQTAVCLYEYSEGAEISYTTKFCEHTGETTTETAEEATCTKDGLKITTCNDCNMVISSEVISALGHEFTEFVETILPTETEQGYDVYKCVRCGETEKQNFVDPTTEYTVEFVVPDGIEAVSSITDAVGSEITLPTANTVLGVEFLGWTTVEYAENEDCPELLTGAYTLTENKTFYALYSYTQGTGDFVKVTEEKTDWSGEYLIVYEDGENAYVFNGVDAVNGYVSATTVNGRIVKNSDLNAVAVTIATMEGGYSIHSSNGYIYQSSNDNGLKFDESAQLNSISWVDGIDIVSSSAHLRFNKASNQMRFRYYKSSSYEGQEVISLYEKDGATYYSTTLPTLTADIDTASLTIGTDLAMNYYVNMSDVYAAAQMKFSMEGLEDVYVNGVKQADGRYKFTFAAIPPQAMSDNISAELIFAETTIATQGTYSIKTYAQNQLNKAESSAELKQLLTDMLYYGAAAQNYKGYNTANLATNGVENLGTASTAEPDSTDFTLVKNEEIDSYPAYFTGATVWFDNVNRIRVKINTTENVTLTINGVAVEVTGTTIDTEGILATQFAETYTFVLSHNDVVMQTLTYSINAYAYAKKDDAKMSELALALYRYGVSAKAYAGV